MALIVKDRVKESTTTAGTADFTLGGAASGFQTFAVIGNSNTTYYAAVDQANGTWEVGIGTYSSTGPTLTRDTVLESSNSGSKVVFAAGSKEVFCTYPAERSVYLDAAGSAVTVLDIGTLGVSTANITTANITAGTVTTTPSAATDLVNKSYVDTLAASGIHFHQPVRVESPINLNATYNNGTAGVGATLTNAGTQAALVIDGITVSVADRVLVYEQTTQTQNGIYVVTDVGSGSTNWILTRASDADTYVINSADGLSEGSSVFVQQGTTGAGETYTCNTSGVITFGTTNITFAQISSAQIYSAGTGLTLSGTQFSITNTGTAGTYGSASTVPVFVTNAQGQVTSVSPTAIAIAAAAVSGLAASATTDTTNAANITSGTLPTGRLNGSYTGITGVGTLAAGTWNGSTIAAIYGGTGLTSFVQGDLLYAASSTTVGRLADEVAGNALISGGVGGDPAWGKIGLGTHVSGTLPVGNGGTGATTLTGYVFGNGTGAFTASASIPNAATTATSANTASAIVARDGSGNFSAGTITASLNGNASTATTAANVNNGALSMAVSGTGLSGSASFTANQSGNSTFTVTSNATNANTGGAIVARDGSGNFSAGTITAALSGNATTATTAGSITSQANSATITASTAANANQIVLRDGNADDYRRYGFGEYFNMSHGVSGATGDTIFYSSTDNYIRKNNATGLRASLNVPTRTGGDASGTWSINVTGSAGSAPANGGTATALNSSNFISQTGNTGTWNSDFQNTPAGTARYGGDVGAQATNNPGGSWWIQQNFRHTNSGGFWGTQVAWGWEDNANRLATRNVQNGSFGGWVYYLNSSNFTSYIDAPNRAGTSYYQANTWIQFNSTYGLYWPNNYGAHLHANDLSTYTQIALRGGKNSYGGIYDQYSAVNIGMYDSSGNGGLYREANGRWYQYHNVSTNCTGFGTSSTNSAYGIYVVKGGYFDGRVDGTIFYDANNTGYYLDPTSTTSLRTVGDWRADSSSWTGEFSGKMQYHSSNWYLQFASNMIFRRSDGTNVMTCDSGGNVSFIGNVTAFSDARIKENVVTIDSALDKVLKLRGVYYNKIDNLERRVGVIAQEIQAVLPEVVRSISDTNPSTGQTQELLAVDYGNITGLLIEAVKELSAQVDALKKGS